MFSSLTDTAQKNYITLGVQKLMDVTCLKFVPYDPSVHTNYVYITVSLINLIVPEFINIFSFHREQILDVIQWSVCVEVDSN